MRSKPIPVSKWDLPTVKTIASAIRDQLVDMNIETPGKRRFLDLIAVGLGHESFSGIKARSEGVRTDGRKFPQVMVDNSDSLVAAIGNSIKGVDKEIGDRIRDVVKNAAGLDEELVHHLTMHWSKHYYWSAADGFFYSEKPIDDGAAAEEIFPLVHVSLIEEGLEIPYCSFETNLNEFDLSDFLLFGWSYDYEGQLFGIPDRLVMHKTLEEHANGIREFCEKLNVALDLVDDTNRPHRRKRRQCAEKCFHKDGASLGIRDLEDASYAYNNGAEYYFDIGHVYSYQEIARCDLFEGREGRFFDPIGKKDPGDIEMDDNVVFINTPFDDYLHIDKGRGALSGPMVFQSWVGGGQVLSADYLIETLVNSKAGDNVEEVEHLIGFVECVGRCWPGSLTRLRQQRELVVEKGLSRNSLWLFDAWYFGVLTLTRRGIVFGIKTNRVFTIENTRDLIVLSEWAVSRKSVATLLDIGSSQEKPAMAWIGLYSDSWVEDETLYFLIDRDALEEWRKQAILPKWLCWGSHNFDTSDVIALLDGGMSVERGQGCAYNQWKDLAYWNGPLMDLHDKYEAHFMGELTSELSSNTDRILASITHQTRLLYEWVPWPIDKGFARELVSQLWEFESYADLLENLEKDGWEDDSRLNRLLLQEADKQYREEMQNVLLNLSLEMQHKNPFSYKLREDGARMVIDAMLEREQGRWMLVQTEAGDWICQNPNKWHEADDVLDRWANARNKEDHLKAVYEVLEEIPDHVGALSIAAWLEFDLGRKPRADEISEKAYNLCVAAMPKKFDMFKDEVTWGFVANRDFHRALYCRASILEELGQHADARELYRGLLMMNPSDNVGVRDSDLVSEEMWQAARKQEEDHRDREDDYLSGLTYVTAGSGDSEPGPDDPTLH